MEGLLSPPLRRLRQLPLLVFNGPWSLILPSVRYLVLRSIYFIFIQKKLRAFLPNGERIEKIKIALIGIGNCSSSLIQGIYYYRDKDPQDMIGNPINHFVALITEFISGHM